MRFGSLFAGIGGFDLGLERAGMTCSWQVEIDDDANEVLARRWPQVPRYRDIRGLTGLPPVDLICGGFPCQDLSPANNAKGKGLDGEKSGLWREYARIVAELRPKWVLIENTGHGWRRWVPFVRRDLHDLGYASVPVCLRAGDFGAPHERARCFIIAATDAYGAELRDQSRRGRRESRRARETIAAIAHQVRGAPDTHCEGQLQQTGALEAQRRRPRDCAWWAAEPSVARVVHRVPGRMDTTRRSKLLGNSVCPPIAEWLGRMILEADHDE